MTKADEGVAPTPRGTAHLGNPVSASAGIGVAELTHELVREQLSDYLDDGLGESARRRIDRHLASCRPCAAYLATLRTTIRGVQQLPAPKAPRGAAARIIDQARRGHDKPGSDA